MATWLGQLYGPGWSAQHSADDLIDITTYSTTEHELSISLEALVATQERSTRADREAEESFPNSGRPQERGWSPNTCDFHAFHRDSAVVWLLPMYMVSIVGLWIA